MKLASWVSRSSSDLPLSLSQFQEMFMYGGLAYQYGLGSSSIQNGQEPIEASFEGYVAGAYKRNGIVFACMMVRSLLFQEARFQFREMNKGRPGDLFGTDALSLVEKPWPGGTTRDLLARAIQDVDLAGNFYAYRRDPGRLVRLQPDWVTIVMGGTRVDWRPGDLDTELAGYMYQPGGPKGGRDPIVLRPELVAHWAPYVDPIATYRGMSWLTPVLREILGDGASTDHKLKFLENGGTPNTVVSMSADVKPEEFKQWVKILKKEHEENSDKYKWLYLGGGADISVVGTDMRRMDFKALQAAGETRIASAAGLPPVIAGFSEGLAAATYSNYGQARRRFADGTMRPLWGGIAGSLQNVVEVPGRSMLWYDDRDIPFLQEDQKDLAEIQQTKAIAIRQLVESGYEADSVVEAVQADDFSKLKHSGLFSTLLQPANPDATNSNGSQNGAGAPLLPAGQ